MFVIGLIYIPLMCICICSRQKPVWFAPTRGETAAVVSGGTSRRRKKAWGEKGRRTPRAYERKRGTGRKTVWQGEEREVVSSVSPVRKVLASTKSSSAQPQPPLLTYTVWFVWKATRPSSAVVFCRAVFFLCVFKKTLCSSKYNWYTYRLCPLRRWQSPLIQTLYDNVKVDTRIKRKQLLFTCSLKLGKKTRCIPNIHDVQKPLWWWRCFAAYR